MNRCQLAGACLVWITAIGSTCRGVTLGPAEDFRGVIVASAAPTMGMTLVSANGWNLKDSNQVYLAPGSPDAYLRGAAYATSATPDFAGPVTITTVYGVDVDPAASALAVGGFDPVDPQVDSIFDEMYFASLSGTWYPATVALTPTYSDLAALLPGYDLSPFSGSPTSFFYLFQATVPGSEFQFIPEPATFSLAGGAGLLTLGAIARRGRRPGRGRRQRA